MEPTTWIGVLLALLTMQAWRQAARSRSRRGLAWGSSTLLVLYLGVATPLGANALLRPLEDAARRAGQDCAGQEAPPDVAVLLAGGVSPGATGASDYEFLSEASLRRSIAAAQWAKEDGSRRLWISGGWGEPPEAELMARLITDLGVARDRLTLDRSSVNTGQTAAWAAQRLQAEGRRAVVLITSADHMLRAQAEFTRRGLAVCARPLEFRHVAPLFPGHLIPQISALTKSTRALHEYLGRLKTFWPIGKD